MSSGAHPRAAVARTWAQVFSTDRIKGLRAKLRRAISDGFLRRMLKNSAWMVVSQLTSAILGMIQIAMLTRLLGREQYGALVLITSAALTVRQFLSVRVWEWTTKEFAASVEHLDAKRGAVTVKSGLFLGATVNLLAFAALAISAPSFRTHFLKDVTPTWMIVVYGGTFLGSWAYDTCFSALRAANLFRYLAIQGVAFSAVRLAVLGATVFSTRSLGAIVCAYAAFEVVGGLWLLWKTLGVFRTTFGVALFRVSTDGILATLRQNKRLLVVSSLIDTVKLVASRLDVLLLGALTVPAAVASYQAAFNFVDVLNRLATPLSLVVFSDLARTAAQGDGAKLMTVVKKTWLVGAVGSAVVCVLLFTLAGPMVHLVYGSSYEDAIVILRILAFSPLWLAGVWMQPAFASVGKPGWSLETTIMIAVVKIALLVALVPWLGGIGVAIANTAYYVLFAASTPWYAARLRKLVNSPEFRPPPQQGTSS